MFSAWKQKPWWIRLIAITLTIAFINQDLIWAQESIPAWPNKANGNLNADIVIPKDIGTVKEVFKGSGGGAKTIINIQDAHSSLSAQESISSILDSLAANYDLKLVAIEGSSGYIDTSVLKTFPDKKIRDSTAKALMAKGKMSAGEFYSVTSNKNITLYGIENKDLYKENVEEFRRVYQARQSVSKDIDSLLKALNQIRDKIYSPELKALELNSVLKEDSSVSFTERWKYVDSLAAKLNIARDNHPNLKRLTESIKLEKSVSFGLANKERDALIDAISKPATKSDLERLVSKSLSFKQGKISQGEYYLLLQALAKDYSIDPRSYKNLISFTNYVTLYESIDLLGIFEEAEMLEDAIRERLYTSPDQKKLRDILKCANFIKGIFELKLTNSGFAELEKDINIYNAKIMADFIRRFDDSGYSLDNIFSNLPAAISFYKTAEKRNNAMLENTIARMNKEGLSVAALITGGYHTKGISEILKQKEASYLVVLPKFDASKSERPYAAILTNKNENSSGELELYAFIKEIISVNLKEAKESGKNVNDIAELWIESYRANYEKLKTSVIENDEISPSSSLRVGHGSDIAPAKQSDAVIASSSAAVRNDGDQNLAITANFPQGDIVPSIPPDKFADAVRAEEHSIEPKLGVEVFDKVRSIRRGSDVIPVMVCNNHDEVADWATRLQSEGVVSAATMIINIDRHPDAHESVESKNVGNWMRWLKKKSGWTGRMIWVKGVLGDQELERFRDEFYEANNIFGSIDELKNNITGPAEAIVTIDYDAIAPVEERSLVEKGGIPADYIEKRAAKIAEFLFDGGITPVAINFTFSDYRGDKYLIAEFKDKVTRAFMSEIERRGFIFEEAHSSPRAPRPAIRVEIVAESEWQAEGLNTRLDPAILTRMTPFEEPHFIISDLHGVPVERLREILRHIGFIDDDGAVISGNKTLVIKGDIIDRGPASLELLKYILNLQREAMSKGCMVKILLGNHEAMLYAGIKLNDDNAMINWLHNRARAGDRAAIELFGEYETFYRATEITRREIMKNPEWAELYEAIRGAIESGDIQACYAKNGVLFVHANVRPDFVAGRSAAEVAGELNRDLKEGRMAKGTNLHNALWDKFDERQPNVGFLLMVSHVPTGGIVKVSEAGGAIDDDIGFSEQLGFNTGYIEISGKNITAHKKARPKPETDASPRDAVVGPDKGADAKKGYVSAGDIDAAAIAGTLTAEEMNRADIEGVASSMVMAPGSVSAFHTETAALVKKVVNDAIEKQFGPGSSILPGELINLLNRVAGKMPRGGISGPAGVFAREGGNEEEDAMAAIPEEYRDSVKELMARNTETFHLLDYGEGEMVIVTRDREGADERIQAMMLEIGGVSLKGKIEGAEVLDHNGDRIPVLMMRYRLNDPDAREEVGNRASDFLRSHDTNYRGEITIPDFTTSGICAQVTVKKYEVPNPELSEEASRLCGVYTEPELNKAFAQACVKVQNSLKEGMSREMLIRPALDAVKIIADKFKKRKEADNGLPFLAKAIRKMIIASEARAGKLGIRIKTELARVPDARARLNTAQGEARAAIEEECGIISRTIELTQKQKNNAEMVERALRELWFYIINPEGDFMEEVLNVKALTKECVEGNKPDSKTPIVIFSDALTPQDINFLTKKYNVAAIVTQNATITSHWVVYANDKGIPVVIVSSPELSKDEEPGDARTENNLQKEIEGLINTTLAKMAHGAYLDEEINRRLVLIGGNGEVVIGPHLATVRQFLERITDETALNRLEEEDAKGPRESVSLGYTGATAALFANADTIEEIESAIKEYEAAGIGLFRTEYLFMGTEKDIPLEEFLRAYFSNAADLDIKRSLLKTGLKIYFKNMAKAVEGKPIKVRVIDFTPDKVTLIHRYAAERNIKLPFGFDFYKDKTIGREIIAIEIEALMEAYLEEEKALGMEILFPMIRDKNDVDYLESILLKDAKEKVSKASAVKRRMLDKISVGVMLETQESIDNIHELVRVDGITSYSIGTNDLWRYVMSGIVKRPLNRDNSHDNRFLAKLYPAPMMAVREIIREIKEANREHPDKPKELNICGEMARKRRFLAALVFQIDKREVGPGDIPLTLSMTAYAIRPANLFLKNILKSHYTAARVTTFLKDGMDELGAITIDDKAQRVAGNVMNRIYQDPRFLELRSALKEELANLTMIEKENPRKEERTLHTLLLISEKNGEMANLPSAKYDEGEETADEAKASSVNIPEETITTVSEEETRSNQRFSVSKDFKVTTSQGIHYSVAAQLTALRKKLGVRIFLRWFKSAGEKTVLLSPPVEMINESVWSDYILICGSDIGLTATGSDEANVNEFMSALTDKTRIKDELYYLKNAPIEQAFAEIPEDHPRRGHLRHAAMAAMVVTGAAAALASTVLGYDIDVLFETAIVVSGIAVAIYGTGALIHFISEKILVITKGSGNTRKAMRKMATKGIKISLLLHDISFFMESGKYTEAIIKFEMAAGSYLDLCGRKLSVLPPAHKARLKEALKAISGAIDDIGKYGNFEQCVLLINAGIILRDTIFVLEEVMSDTNENIHGVIHKTAAERIIRGEVSDKREIEIRDDEPVLKMGDIIFKGRDNRVFSFGGIEESMAPRGKRGLPIRYVRLIEGSTITRLELGAFVQEARAGKYIRLVEAKIGPERINELVSDLEKAMNRNELEGILNAGDSSTRKMIVSAIKAYLPYARDGNAIAFAERILRKFDRSERIKALLIKLFENLRATEFGLVLWVFVPMLSGACGTFAVKPGRIPSKAADKYHPDRVVETFKSEKNFYWSSVPKEYLEACMKALVAELANSLGKDIKSLSARDLENPAIVTKSGDLKSLGSMVDFIERKHDLYLLDAIEKISEVTGAKFWRTEDWDAISEGLRLSDRAGRPVSKGWATRDRILDALTNINEDNPNELLTAEAEAVLSQELEKGNKAAYIALFWLGYSYAMSWADKNSAVYGTFGRSDLDEDDMVRAASRSLSRSALRFDFRKGKFGDYISYCMKNARRHCIISTKRDRENERELRFVKPTIYDVRIEETPVYSHIDIDWLRQILAKVFGELRVQGVKNAAEINAGTYMRYTFENKTYVEIAKDEAPEGKKPVSKEAIRQRLVKAENALAPYLEEIMDAALTTPERRDDALLELLNYMRVHEPAASAKSFAGIRTAPAILPFGITASISGIVSFVIAGLGLYLAAGILPYLRAKAPPTSRDALKLIWDKVSNDAKYVIDASIHSHYTSPITPAPGIFDKYTGIPAGTRERIAEVRRETERLARQLRTPVLLLALGVALFTASSPAAMLAVFGIAITNFRGGNFQPHNRFRRGLANHISKLAAQLEGHENIDKIIKTIDDYWYSVDANFRKDLEEIDVLSVIKSSCVKRANRMITLLSAGYIDEAAKELDAMKGIARRFGQVLDNGLLHSYEVELDLRREGYPINTFVMKGAGSEELGRITEELKKMRNGTKKLSTVTTEGGVRGKGIGIQIDFKGTLWANPADIYDIRDIEYRLSTSDGIRGFSMEGYIMGAPKQDTYCLLVRYDDSVIGYAVYDQQTIRDTKIVNVLHLAVDPDFQGLGVGEAIIDRLKRYVQVRKYDELRFFIPDSDKNMKEKLREREFKSGRASYKESGGEVIRKMVYRPIRLFRDRGIFGAGMILPIGTTSFTFGALNLIMAGLAVYLTVVILPYLRAGAPTTNRDALKLIWDKAIRDAKYIINMFIHPYYGVVSVSDIDSLTRSRMAALIKELVPAIESMSAAEIFASVQEKRKADPNFGRKIDELRTLVAEHIEALNASTLYNDPDIMKTALPAAENASVVITEESALSNPAFGAGIEDVLNAKSNVSFLFGRDMSEEQAGRFLVESGLKPELANKINLVTKIKPDGTMKTMEEIEEDIVSRMPEGLSPDNAAIVIAPGELRQMGGNTARMKVLELKEMNIGGRTVLLSMNTERVAYRIALMDEAPEGSMPLDKELPGLYYDSNTKRYTYLPPMIPANLGLEVETYRNAMLLLSSSA